MAWIIGLVGFALIPSIGLWQLWPPRMEKLGPNRWSGMRTIMTTRSDEAWSSAHRAAWKPALLSGAAMYAVLLAAIPVALRQSPGASQTDTAVVAGAIGTFIWSVGIVIAYYLAQRAAGRTAPPGS